MDYPAVVFPVGRHRVKDYSTSPSFVYPSTPRNAAEKFVIDQWDPTTYENAPVALQLVGRRLNEEKLLGILSVVESAVGIYKA